ncbi:MAG TPA: rhomboid family intramembrane serine protease [Saprospiraceae bacterium]|nr:rhomboid family intramembrane serine protease [Saprospiraceae bacterium]
MDKISFKKRLTDSIRIPVYLIAFLWLIHGLQALLGFDFGYYGVYPRTLFGLRGILFSPMIHGDWGHLLANTPPLFAMSAMILFFYRKVAIPSFTLIYLLSGLAVWGFGRQVFHIGASGVVYGLVAFVFFSGIFRRNLKSIVLALIVLMYYGSMFLGVLPGREGVSWESHLLGAVVGIIVAFLYRNNIEEDERPKRYAYEEDSNLLREDFFLKRDIFDKTKREREAEERRDGDWWSNSSW